MNLSLLTGLYKVHTPDLVGEGAMRALIKAFLGTTGKNFKIVEEDNNLYVYPKRSKNRHVILSAHLDQVETAGPVKYLRRFCTSQVPHNLFLGTGYEITYNDPSGEIIVGYNDKGLQTSLGADDKNGIYLALQMYNTLPQDKLPTLLFFSEEETGRIGSRSANLKEVTNNCLYAIILDRKGHNEVLTGAGSSTLYGIHTARIIAENIPGMRYGKGSLSDADSTSYFVDSCNLAVGYYNAHRASEYTNLTELAETELRLCNLFNSEVFPNDIWVKKSWLDIKTHVDGKFVPYSSRSNYGSYGYGQSNHNQWWNKSKEQAKSTTPAKTEEVEESALPLSKEEEEILAAYYYATCPLCGMQHAYNPPNKDCAYCGQGVQEECQTGMNLDTFC